VALTTLAAVNAALPGQVVPITKSTTGGGAGNWYGLWALAGSPVGALPSSGLSGNVPTSATAGGVPFVNPTAPALTYLARVTGSGIGATSAQSTYFSIYDRLWQNSGLSSTLITAQTVNSVALTRPDALGAGVEAWWQVYAAMGAGTPTVTLSYTDQDGTAGNSASSGALGSAMAIRLAGQFTLAAGDTGVRSIQSWTASATFTSGTIGLVLRRHVAAFALLNVSLVTQLDAVALGLPRVYDSACLEVMMNPATGFNVGPNLALSLVQG